PNCVLMIGEVCPFSNTNAACSNSLTILPRVKVPRSPPCFPDGQSETSLATLENFSPLFSLSTTVCASFSVFTRICAQCTSLGRIRFALEAQCGPVLQISLVERATKCVHQKVMVFVFSRQILIFRMSTVTSDGNCRLFHDDNILKFRS